VAAVERTGRTRARVRPLSYRALALDVVAVYAAYALALLVRIGGRFEQAEPELASVFILAIALIQAGMAAPLGAYREGRSIARARDLVALVVPALLTGALIAAFDAVSPLRPIPRGAIPTSVAFAAAAVIAVHLRSRLPALARVAFPRDVPRAARRPAGRPDVSATLVPKDATLRDAIAAIDRDVSHIALVVDAERRLLGTITDGDVRRALLSGAGVGAPSATAMRQRPLVALAGASETDIVLLMRDHNVRQLPLVDGSGRVVDIRVLDIPDDSDPGLAPVLVMAGGRGTRLADVTGSLPKPLVRVAGRPILETLIRDLADQQFGRVILAVSYRSDQIERHFGDGRAFGLDITYVKEPTPLGTAGAIRLVAPQVGGPFLVTNADVLTRVSFRDLLEFHSAQGHQLTIGAITSTQQLRYGLLETEGSRVTALREKPALRHLVNAGIYVVDPSCAELIPADTRVDMDQLIGAALARSFRVGCFPIHEYWTDVGVPADLERATREYPAELVRGRQ
jgi:dTDP-glucose pyrophosphorylase/CBS domain-containing protein